MPDKKINLVISLVPVGPRTKKNMFGNRHFAIHLAAAFDPATPPETAAEVAMLLPWESNWQIPEIKVAVNSNPANPPTATPVIQSKKNPNSLPAPLKRLRDEVILKPDIPANQQPKIKDPLWKPSSSGTRNEPKLIETINTMGLYPGAIPNDLKLLHYFKIITNGWMPSAGEKLVVAPTIKIGALTFTPNTFDFAQNKWSYTLTGGQGFEMTGIVKELKININADQIVSFDDEPVSADAATLGLNFQTYWLRSQKTHPWSELLEDYVDETLDTGGRLADARSGLELNHPQLVNFREDWQLMALAVSTQWRSVTNLESHNAENIKRQLSLLLEIDPAGSEISRLQQKLDELRVELSRPKMRAQIREVWLEIFRRGLADAELNVQTLLLRAKEKAEEFDLALFYIWDFAVHKLSQLSSDNLLREKWDRALLEKRDAFLQIFTGRADAADYGVKVIRQKLKDKKLDEFEQSKNLDEVRAKMKISLETAFVAFEHADFIPQIVKESDLTALELDPIRRNWHSYIQAYIKQITDAPQTESKPRGLTIQFDELEKRTPVANPLANPQNWRKLNGIGLLVREAGKNWSLATAARVNLRDIAIKKVEWVNDTTIRLTVNIRSEANIKHDLVIGDLLFREVFETGADGTITPDNQLEIAPSFAAPFVQNKVLDIRLKPTAPFRFNQKKLPNIEFQRKTLLLDETALIPATVPYKKGIRHPFLTYNQRSIIAPTALADATKPYFKATDNRTSGLSWTAPYEYGAAKTDDNTLFDLVQLKFGRQNYELAAFMVDTAGGVPDKLAGAFPWIFKSLVISSPPVSPPDFNPKFEVPEAAIVKFEEYWRKVPVGQVRVSAGTIFRKAEKFILRPQDWKEIPEKVSPLAWEVETRNRLQPNESLPIDIRRTQLALLYGDPGVKENETYVFGIRPPTVDIDVLERWLPKTQNNLLSACLKDYFFRLKELERLGGTASEFKPQFDLSIDDPAVENLLFVLERYDFSETDKSRVWKTVKTLNHAIVRSAGNNLGKFQSDWVKVLCRRSADVDFKLAAADPTTGFQVVVDVPKNEVHVARLRIAALVSKRFAKENHAEQRFEKDFFRMASAALESDEKFLFLEDFDRYFVPPVSGETQNIADLKNQTEYICLKNYSVLLETPNASLPAPTEVWKALVLRRPEKDLIRVLLSDTHRKQNTAWRNIIRCELLRQQWRWQGRPIPRKDNNNIDLIEKLLNVWTTDGVVDNTADNEFLSWEMTMFAAMDEEFDTLHFPLQFSHNAPPLLYEDKFDKDLLARYLRYGLRIFSRYEGLFDLLPRTSQQPYQMPDERRLALSGIGWQRAFVRYRADDKLLPKVRAIVPLTQGFAENDKTLNGRVAPLMMVLDETFFSQCGFTEWIEGEVVKVEDWRPIENLPGDQFPDDLPEEKLPRKMLHQTAPDSIVTTENILVGSPGRPKLPNADVPTIKLKLRLKGPFGHTTDTGARQPLFGHSSFILQPVADYPGHVAPWEFFGWDFAKVRFRRLSSNETVQTPAETEWTDPIWIQFLPSAEFISSDVWTLGVDIVPVAEKKKFVVNCKAKHPTIEENPLPKLLKEIKDHQMFKYCLVLTYRISDFRGQTENEAYTDYLILNEELESRTDFFTDLIKHVDILQARLVEVQSTPYIDAQGTRKYTGLPSKTLWEELLKVNPDDQNTPYRATRASKPIIVEEKK